MNWLVLALSVAIVWSGILPGQIRFTNGFPDGSCQFHADNSSLVCTNLTSTTWTLASIDVDDVQSLLLFNVDSPEVNLSVFRNLRKLVIQHTNVGDVTNLQASPRLEEIDISHNPRLESINLDNLPNIRTLNLSYNGLQDIDGRPLLDLRLTSVDLKGNKWMCKNDYSWAVRLNETGKLENWRDFNCTVYDGGDEWNKHLYRILHYVQANKIVQQQCSQRVPECRCAFYDLEPTATEILYDISVTCTGLNLKELPQEVPDRTLRLDLSNNSISSLGRVKDYPHLHQLVLDNNNITSARELVKTNFIQQFSLLSLKSNPIPPEEIPFNELELKSSERGSDNSGLRLILLENNSWVCNDYLAEVVQKWLWRNRQLLQQDLTRTSTQPLKIYCSDEYGKPVNVFFLFPSPAPKDWDAVLLWQWVIGLEVSLIVFVLTKLAFDAYVFKTHNRLPWLATKLFK